MARVYPRVYGGTEEGRFYTESMGGLSPRVRGNLVRITHTSPAKRSIPACTGEPSPGRPNVTPIWVYPRVYGGTFVRISRLTFRQGLSPRVRGNPILSIRKYFGSRSIPACTGEPSGMLGAYVRTEVYPRVYGGTDRGHGVVQ